MSIQCRGKWLEFVEGDLKFDRSLSVMFMRIATWVDVEYSGPARNMLQRLPPDYTTIYKIARLDGETFTRLLEDGTIHPSIGRNEVSKILRLERVGADEQRVLNLMPVVGKYRTIVLDPAWDYVWLSLAGRAKPG